MLREPLREIERRGPSAVVAEQAGEFLLKSRVDLRPLVFVREFEERRHQRLGDKHPAKLAKVAVPVGERLQVDHRARKLGGRLRGCKGFQNKNPAHAARHARGFEICSLSVSNVSRIRRDGCDAGASARQVRRGQTKQAPAPGPERDCRGFRRRGSNWYVRLGKADR